MIRRARGTSVLTGARSSVECKSGHEAPLSFDSVQTTGTRLRASHGIGLNRSQLVINRIETLLHLEEIRRGFVRPPTKQATPEFPVPRSVPVFLWPRRPHVLTSYQVLVPGTYLVPGIIYHAYPLPNMPVV